jgi:hypothetical protein
VKAQPHDEIVRMLSIDNRLAVRGFASLEQQWIAAIRDGGGVQAQHQIHLKCAIGPGAMFSRSHEPVG